MTATSTTSVSGPVRVACADDQPAVRDAVSRALDPRSFVLVGAVSEVASLDWLLETARPAILLLDVDMPGGERPLAWLARSAGCYPDLRVVMYSGFVSRALVDEALSAGAWGYLDKGDDPARLSGMLGRLLEGEMVFSPTVPVG